MHSKHKSDQYQFHLLAISLIIATVLNDNLVVSISPNPENAVNHKVLILIADSTPTYKCRILIAFFGVHWENPVQEKFLPAKFTNGDELDCLGGLEYWNQKLLPKILETKPESEWAANVRRILDKGLGIGGPDKLVELREYIKTMPDDELMRRPQGQELPDIPEYPETNEENRIQSPFMNDNNEPAFHNSLDNLISVHKDIVHPQPEPRPPPPPRHAPVHKEVIVHSQPKPEPRPPPPRQAPVHKEVIVHSQPKPEPRPPPPRPAPVPVPAPVEPEEEPDNSLTSAENDFKLGQFSPRVHSNEDELSRELDADRNQEDQDENHDHGQPYFEVPQTTPKTLPPAKNKKIFQEMSGEFKHDAAVADAARERDKWTTNQQPVVEVKVHQEIPIHHHVNPVEDDQREHEQDQDMEHPAQHDKLPSYDEGIPVWAYILITIAGLLVLAGLIILIMHCCRKRSNDNNNTNSDREERQKLVAEDANNVSRIRFGKKARK